MRTKLPIVLLGSFVLLLISSSGFSQSCPLVTHNAFTNFNGTPSPPAPTSLWLNIHTKLDNTDLVNNGDFLQFAGGVISLTGVTSSPAVSNVPIPNGTIVADNTVHQPVTSYDMTSNSWTTRVPPGYSTSDIFISGAIINSTTGFSVSAGKSSTVTGSFISNRPSFKQSWFYGLATYRPAFVYADIAGPGQVTSVGGGVQAGTPLPEKPDLVAGGSGGGGSNFTGSYSSTDNFMTCQKAGCSLSGTVQKTDVTCNGAANGSLTVSLTGGTSPYSYSNSGSVFFFTPHAVTTFNNRPPGVYSFTVTDGAGCKVNLSATIAQPTALSVTATVVNGDFQHSCDGAATINVTGGAPPYTYSWSDGVTTSSNSRNNLCGPPPGSGTPITYTVTVTDANGCSASVSFLIDVSSVRPSSVSTFNMAKTRELEEPAGAFSARVFPNPSSGWVSLQINAKERSNAQVNVIDMNGRIIKTYVINLEMGMNTKTLQLPNSSHGLYRLQINTGKDVKNLPILLQ